MKNPDYDPANALTSGKNPELAKLHAARYPDSPYRMDQQQTTSVGMPYGRRTLSPRHDSDYARAVATSPSPIQRVRIVDEDGDVIARARVRITRERITRESL